jgi:5'(3')-deoxyribonucleotidase
METRKLAIGIDLDGVVFDFCDNYRDYLVQHHKFDKLSLPDAEVWDFFSHQWNLTTEDFLHFLAQGIEDEFIFVLGDPVVGAVDAIRKLGDQGHCIHIVTHRMFGAKSIANTERWLRDNDISYNSLTFSADKTIVKTDVFLEDNVENFQALESVGVRAYLMDRKWNAHYDTGYRVFDWDDFIRTLENSFLQPDTLTGAM